MSSADLSTVVIACPNCGTRYQLPYGALGASGREVQCAQCARPWHAVADAPIPPAIEDDRLFTAADEHALDIAFEAEARTAGSPALPRTPDHEKTLAEIKAAIKPKAYRDQAPALDPALLNRSRRNFDIRQRLRADSLPVARLRRAARITALLLLLGVVATGYLMRTELVRWYPSLAGLYSAIGLPVNVVGLEFENSRTVMSFRAGKPVMLITSRIRSVAPRTVVLPPVLVSLVNASGETVYEWTVTLNSPDMAPGEIIEFSTEVTAPPSEAATVRLSFANRRAGGPSTAPTGTV